MWKETPAPRFLAGSEELALLSPEAVPCHPRTKLSPRNHTQGGGADLAHLSPLVSEHLLLAGDDVVRF